MTRTITPSNIQQGRPSILKLVEEIAETSQDTIEQGTRFENLVLGILPQVDLPELTGHEVARDNWVRWNSWAKRDQYGRLTVPSGVT